MKKVLISATLLIGMMASVMVFSSFTTSRENVNVLDSKVNVQGDWRRVGTYKGYDASGKAPTYSFTIWEQDGMCGSYYWVYYMDINPDECFKYKKEFTGKLMKDSEGRWYAALYGDKYYISL